MEPVVLHRVAFLEYFCPKQGQDFKPSAAPLYPNMGQVPPPGNVVFISTISVKFLLKMIIILYSLSRSVGRYDRICSNSLLPHSPQLQDEKVGRVGPAAVVSLCLLCMLCFALFLLSVLWLNFGHKSRRTPTASSMHIRTTADAVRPNAALARAFSFPPKFPASSLLSMSSRLAVCKRVTFSRFWFPSSRRDWRIYVECGVRLNKDGLFVHSVTGQSSYVELAERSDASLLPEPAS